MPAFKRCSLEPSETQHVHFERKWIDAKRAVLRSGADLKVDPEAFRYLDTYQDVQVALHLDIPVSRMPGQDPLGYAQWMIKQVNDLLQLKTNAYAEWAALSPAQMTATYGLPAQVATAVYNYVHPPVAGAPRLRLVLSSVSFRPAHTGFTVNPENESQVAELKHNRLPFEDGLFNIWVTTLTQSVLGFAQFPFEVERKDYGVVVDYRTTHPSLAEGHPSFQPYSSNYTMAHEVLHAWGIFHPFTNSTAPLVEDFGALANPIEGGPSNPQYLVGDGAALTPPQDVPSVGDPLNQYSLYPNVFNQHNEVVAFVNPANYTQDSSYLALTIDQVGRVEYFWNEDVALKLVTAFTDTGIASYDSLPAPTTPVRVRELQDGYSSGGGGLSAGAIAGIVVGALVVLALLIGVGIAFSKSGGGSMTTSSRTSSRRLRTNSLM